MRRRSGWPTAGRPNETLRGRGAEFLTAPVEYAWEVRCFFRDRDGHLLEFSEAKASTAGA